MALVEITPENRRWFERERTHGYIRVRLRLLTSDEGGRLNPIVSGYRSCWGFPPELHDEMHDAPLLLEQGSSLGLGQIGDARIHPLWPQGWPEITPGMKLGMFEGPRLVGTAEVLEKVEPGDSLGD